MAAERVPSFVNFKTHLTPTPRGCIEWSGHRNSQGYGKFSIDGHGMLAHRVVLGFCDISIPKGMQVDHLCRNTSCVNPHHLVLATPWENTMRGYGPTRFNASKTHCIRGHEFTEENTAIRKDTGHRQCRTCRADYFSELHRKQKENPVKRPAPACCKQGHDLLGDLLAWSATGKWRCLQCERDDAAARRKQRKAAV